MYKKERISFRNRKPYYSLLDNQYVDILRHNMSFKTILYHKGIEEKYILQICENRYLFGYYYIPKNFNYLNTYICVSGTYIILILQRSRSRNSDFDWFGFTQQCLDQSKWGAKDLSRSDRVMPKTKSPHQWKFEHAAKESQLWSSSFESTWFGKPTIEQWHAWGTFITYCS